MKKIVLLFAATLLCLFTACTHQNKLSGKIIETNIDESTGLVSFVVHTDSNKDVGIFLTDETYIFTFVDGFTVDEFKEGSFTDITVSVEHAQPQKTLSMANGRKITAYNAKQIDLTGFLTTKTATLSDGTHLSVFNYFNGTAYILPNDIELLREQCPIGPNNVYVAGVESFDDLSPKAQKKVMAFYHEQGLLYDLQAELEKAYAGYLQQEDAATFNSYMISQDIAPTASTESAMYFLTSVHLPIDGNHGYEHRIGTAFNKKTGNYISNWDLFSCSPEEAMQTILDIADITNPDLRKEMENAFVPENIIFFPDNLEVCFQQGTLPSQEHAYLLGLDYDDRLCAILYPWAVPVTQNN